MARDAIFADNGSLLVEIESSIPRRFSLFDTSVQSTSHSYFEMGAVEFAPVGQWSISRLGARDAAVSRDVWLAFCTPMMSCLAASESS